MTILLISNFMIARELCVLANYLSAETFVWLHAYVTAAGGQKSTSKERLPSKGKKDSCYSEGPEH